MLRLADAWTWDFWLADDGRDYHLYFLKAPRSIGDPDQRHWNVTVGHAVSADLAHWSLAEDALGPAACPAFDDMTTWTGSVARGPDGTWFMFYTGGGSRERGLKQRIGLATSADLYHWDRHPASPVLETDSRWYEQLPGASWPDEAWRDPWVFPDPGGDGWHMLITGRSRHGPADRRGVIGHARSDDLVHWQAGPPLSDLDGFGQAEVPQVEVIDGHPVLLFSCLTSELSADRRAAGAQGGIWSVPCESLLGPFDLSSAVRVTDQTLYSGRLIRDRAGQWLMLAFRNADGEGRFVGEITDPMPVSWAPGRTGLVIRAGSVPQPPAHFTGPARNERP